MGRIRIRIILWLRNLSIIFDQKMQHIILPDSVFVHIAKGNLMAAEKEIKEAEEKFGCDPIIIKAKILIKRKQLIGK